MDPITQKYPIFGQFTRVHTAEKLVEFASRLRYFYLFGSFFSGHAEFYEMVECRILFSNEDDLHHKLSKLVDLIPVGNLDQIQDYPPPSPMESLPEFLNPGKTQIKNLPLQQTFVYISEGDGFFTISLHGDGKNDYWGVNENTIKNANLFEKHLENIGLADSVDHSIASHFNCISRVNFPEAF
ncbi:MAG: hypothetical protein JJT78_09585 [Leptospira sp.]|nr:hypothetical protein [Leptospira sp.]